MGAWILELVSLLLLTMLQSGSSINCYTCSSVNGSSPSCEDPFHPAMSNYTEKCMVPKKGHTGVFPANFCIKIVGENTEVKERMVIRACVMKTMDSQCGVFRYQDSTMTGCILTCDFDGCNSAPPHQNPLAGTGLLLTAIAIANFNVLPALLKWIQS
nr:PREDICTED: uncharacterized protein LOC109034465 [Bemisia tabaci]XP_018903178.1 PREDICTED: uncharacterized protein LOC109034465 [Bemisia tabaci]